MVRLDASWSGVEREPGAYDWSSTDATAAWAAAAGARWLPIACYGNTWASPKGDIMRGPLPEHEDAFAAYCARLGARYPRAAAIEVWNEPNLIGFGDMSPAQYSRLYLKAYEAIRAVSDLPVLCGCIADAGFQPQWFTFLKRVVKFCDPDDVSIHSYFGPRTIGESRAIVGADRRLWLTETGLPIEVAPRHRARFLRRVRESCERHHVHARLFYARHDPGWLPSDASIREWLRRR